MYQSNPKRYTREQYSSPSIDDTTLDDDDPVDQLHINDDDEEGYYPQMGNYDDKYLNEKNAINDAQSVRYTAYTMKQDNGNSIVAELRNVGVTVLSLESLSTSAMIHYMDAVTSMRLGEANDEKCMLYTDRMGRVFNVVISGGSQGLAKSWSIVQASYSGWMAIIAIPFLVRVIASVPFGDGNDTSQSMAINPLMMLLLFAFVLQNETSLVWLAMSINVRGSNSVGSHVWRDGGLTDYSRIVLLTILILAIFSTGIVQRILTWAGAIFGCLILLCNLGSRSWKKIDLKPIDFNSVFSAPIVILASILAGIAFPYMGLRAVDSGSDDSSGKDEVEKIIFHPNGKRGRQNIALASSSAAIVFLMSDIKSVQEALGFDFSKFRGITNFMIGVWLLFSSLVSILLCRRLDSSRSKKIEPFLKRDEISPVGWIVPSIPNIVIDPNLSRNKMFVPGSDIFCSLFVLGLAFLISWTGVRDMQGEERSELWGIF